MIEEQMNVRQVRPDQQPPDGGATLVVRGDNTDSGTLLAKIREVWFVAAGWGRWFNEDLGDWPSLEECQKQLPTWFRFESDPAPLENWMEFLDNRDWGWWSSSTIDQYVKIDIELGSIPFSFYALTFVIEEVGGTIVYKDRWMNSQQLRRHLNLDDDRSSQE